VGGEKAITRNAYHGSGVDVPPIHQPCVQTPLMDSDQNALGAPHPPACKISIRHNRNPEAPLPTITALFWDVGGVLLTNAWDHEERQRALQQFGLDEVEFESRHEMLVSSFERGKITQQEYLERTIFYRPRPFSREVFAEYMFSLSQPDPEALQLAKGLSQSRKYLMSTINNESKELNLYRIQTFGLREIFSLFVSSCFVGLRKPEEGIYRLALEITQRPPKECCFIDDRRLNLDSASKLGMHVIQMKDAEQLRRELQALGVVSH
jgi:putative hydrolase of the HAD superfamily